MGVCVYVFSVQRSMVHTCFFVCLYVCGWLPLTEPCSFSNSGAMYIFNCQITRNDTVFEFQTKEDLLEELTRKQESQMRMIAELDKRLSLLLVRNVTPQPRVVWYGIFQVASYKVAEWLNTCLLVRSMQF